MTHYWNCEGYVTELLATSRQGAIDEIRGEIAGYSDDNATSWYDEWILESDSKPMATSDDWECITIQVDPEEPHCTADSHDWREKQVCCSGGGVAIQDVCSYCGCGRLTDTWAQRPDTGEQGLRSITYDRDYAADCASL